MGAKIHLSKQIHYKWTDEEDELLEILVKMNVPYSKMGKYFAHRKPNGLKQRAKKLGLIDKYPRNDVDLIGKTFGRLTVLERADDKIFPSGQAERMWKCQCSCDKHTILEVSGGNLKSGHTRSCGCLKKEIAENFCDDLIGKMFGRLTVVAKDGWDYYSNGTRRLMWKCKCECGGEARASTNELKSGHIKSCGCLRDEMFGVAEGFISINKGYNKYNLNGDYGLGLDSKGNYFFFDLESFPLIKDICWSVGTDGYVKGPKQKNMPRIILGITDPKIDAEHQHGFESRNDNRLCNIRIATASENNMNTGLRKNNTSGYRGVSWCKRAHMWRAYIAEHNNQYHLGYFKNIEDAIEARHKAEIKLHGDFSYENSQLNDGYFNPNTIEYDPSTFKTVEEAEKDYENLVASGSTAVLEDNCAE